MIKLKTIDFAFLYLIILNVLVFRYFDVMYTNFYIIDAFLLAYLLIRVQTLKTNMTTKYKLLLVSSIVFLFSVILFNAFIHDFNSNGLNNIVITLSPITYLLYFLFIVKKYSFNVLKPSMNKLRIFLNIYFFLNALIIVMQVRTGSFMMSKFLSVNSNAFDHYAGLVGLNGVSVLNFLWIATLLFNLQHFVDKRKKKTISLILLQFSLMAILQGFNDMKMFFMTVAVFIGIFLLISSNKVKIIKAEYKLVNVVRFFFGLVIVPIILVIGFYTFDVQTKIDDANVLVSEFFTGDNVPSVYNERAYLNYLATHTYNGYGSGVGISNLNIANSGIHDHLTIHSSSLIMIQGGLIYLIAIVNLYTVILLSLFKEGNAAKSVKNYVLIFASLMVCSYATEIFRDHYIFISFMLIYLALHLTYRGLAERNKETITLDDQVSSNRILNPAIN